MKRCLMYILVLTLILSGCGLLRPDSAVSSTEIPVVTQQISETNPMTEPVPTELFTEPIIYLEIDAGSYLERYTDPETSDYLDYYLHIPENAVENMPLLVFLHGDGEVGKVSGLENYGPIFATREIYGENFPFIALFPCTRSYSWITGTIPDTLIGLIDAISEGLNVDCDRIILAGHSRGAIGVWNLIGMYGDYFSCAVPISCGPGTMIDYEKYGAVPVRAFAGTEGTYEKNYAAAMRNTVEKLMENGAVAELYILENMSHDQTHIAAFTEETIQWMISQ